MLPRQGAVPGGQKLRLLGLFLSVIIAVTLVACGGDDDSAPASSDESNSASKSSDAAKLVAAGKEGKMSRASVGGTRWAGPDTSPAPFANGKVGILACPLSVEACRRISGAAADAAKAIGWKSIVVDGKGDPATQTAGVESMINQGVNCIVSLAAPARVFAPQIKRAEQKGIKVFTGFADDPRPFGGQGGLGPDNAKAGEVLGAYVIANGGGKVLVFQAPADPQLSERTKGFVDYIKKHGGDETKIVKTVDFSLTEIGPGEITKMKAALQALPKGSVDYVYAPFDATLTPLLQAARELGRTEIKGVSFDGDESALEDIRADPEQGQVATIGWAYEWVSWAAIDECNRALQNKPIGVNKDFPIQLIDSSNLPAKGKRYEAGFDYAGKFKELWGGA